MKAHFIRSQSPGRINIIGEHTDYNDGFVLPAAIDKKVAFTLKKNGTSAEVKFTASDLNESHTFNLTHFQPLAKGWQNYVMGVVDEMQKLGGKIEGFEGAFSSNVPIGSGMSSSAALECSLAFGLNELFELGFDKWQLIKASQMAEHHFVGMKCGIMDQFASVMGKKDHAMLLDCRSLEYRYIPFDLQEYQLLLLNTNVSHTLTDSEYNTRREECEQGVEIIQKNQPEVQSLRDVSYESLLELKAEMPGHIFKRCRHIITENERVLNAEKALHTQSFQLLGKLLYASHDSLKNDYEVSCPELDFLVNQTQAKAYVLGSRMMGGGFGGCTINIIDKQHTSHFIEFIAGKYREQFGIDLTPYMVSIGDGAKLSI